MIIPKNKALKIVSVDFDDTIAHNSGYPDYKVLKPVKGAREALIKLSKKWKIIIYTARPWADYELIETWLKKHKMPFKDIVCGKLLVKHMIDDKAIGFRGDWNRVLDEVSYLNDPGKALREWEELSEEESHEGWEVIWQSPLRKSIKDE